MEHPITIQIGNRNNPPEQLAGFAYFWCKYVSGFDKSVHCAQCLVGYWARGFYPRMKIPAVRVMDEHETPYIYLCGVDRPGGNKGLHVAMEHAPGERILTMTWNGIPVIVENARQLHIPDVPVGYEGYSWGYTTCMNWKFGLAYLSDRPAKAPEPAPKKDTGPKIIQKRLF